MKKRTYIIAAVLSLLILTANSVPTLAQGEEKETVGPKPMLRTALAIHAPRRAPVGEKITMAVSQRNSEERIKDAAIWALSHEAAQALREQLIALREGSTTPRPQLDYESLVSAHGTLLGKTNGNGELKYAFTEAGRYLLVAVKQGFIPGRTGIGIGGAETARTRNSESPAK